MKQIRSYEEIGELEYENRILTVRVVEGLEFTKEILEFIFSEAEKMAGDSTFCILADVRPNASSSSSARIYAAKNPYSKNHLAYATVANTIAVVILANFFIKVNKPAVPSRLFKKEEDALKWLRNFLD